MRKDDFEQSCLPKGDGDDFLEGQGSICILRMKDLQRIMLECINRANTLYEETNRDNLLSKDETMERIKVGSSTLWRWAKTGYLVPIKRGRRIYYKLSDIIRIERESNPIPLKEFL